MIRAQCGCGGLVEAPESDAGRAVVCSQCKTNLQLACAEPLPDGAGEADFDARLVVQQGPQRSGEHLLLGGVADIEVGKHLNKHIALPGDRVSRLHCKLARLDFGPSRWEIRDNQSTNGLFVNGQKISAAELRSGDVVGLGEYQLQYLVHAPIPDAAPAPPPAAPSRPRSARAPAQVSTLSYARPGVTPMPDQKLLGDCDIDWVMKLRNAAMLMVMVININILARIFAPHSLELCINIVTSAMSLLAAWFLTSPEPGVPESLFSVRIFLRIFATVEVVGEVMAAFGALTENIGILLIGGIISLALVPQTFLFLFHLRRLALRIPSTGLAVNAFIVMIGLPAAILMTAGGVVFGAMMRNPIMVILSGLGGLLALFIFRVWYIVLLVWFKRSFS